jgi:hypothetical protein
MKIIISVIISMIISGAGGAPMTAGNTVGDLAEVQNVAHNTYEVATVNSDYGYTVKGHYKENADYVAVINKSNGKLMTLKRVTNRMLVKAYCANKYSNYCIKYVGFNKVPRNRVDGKNIYVEKIKTISHGKYGRTVKGHYYVKYNKTVKKGVKVTSYAIYNPTNNADDDIMAVVDNGKLR